jgi:5-methylcytosine-specific restriction endonuclease McrA
MVQGKLQFDRPLLRSNGDKRKHFRMWMIPKSEIDALGLYDGLSVDVHVSCGSVSGRHSAVLTSGCEFSVGRELSTALSRLTAKPKDIIRFRVTFDEAAAERNLLQRRVEDRRRDTETARLARIGRAPKTPKRLVVRTFAFQRNPDIIAQKLFEAKGRCDECARSAPFKRTSDGSPYLEVHHIIPLGKGGEDTLDNTIALCPNCHRQFHFGLSPVMP